MLAADACVRNLNWIDQRTGRVEANHAKGSRRNRLVVHPSGRSLRHRDLPFQVDGSNLVCLSTAYPSQLGCHVGIAATLTQDGGQVGIIGNLHLLRLHLPQRGADAIPGLGLSQLLDGRVVDAEALQLVYHVVRFHEMRLIFRVLPVALVGSDVHNIMKGPVAR